MMDNSMRLAQIGEEVIPQVEMREPITEGKGSRGRESPKSQRSTRNDPLELFICRSEHSWLLGHRLWGYPRSRAQVGLTRDLG